MIELKGVHKSFGNKQVLRGVDLTIRDGELLVILGRSGTGKSVLLKHIVGLMKPDKGSVIVEGEDVSHVHTAELYRIRRLIGFVFQNSALFDSMTVFENVALPLIERGGMSIDEVRQRVIDVLSLVEMEDAALLMPEELSGGMRKRVAIARALVAEPKYILYDEPTTGLDPIIADRINDLILALKRDVGVTSVVVTHDIHSALKIADRIVLLSGGRIAVEAPRDAVWDVQHEEFRQFLKVFRKLEDEC